HMLMPRRLNESANIYFPGFRIGEVFVNKYRVFAAHGKGVFSTVLRARTLVKGEDGREKEGDEVAIKVIRNNETMYAVSSSLYVLILIDLSYRYRAGLKERDLLKALTAADPNNKRHCIRLISSFMYRNHLCLVLEPMQ